MHNNSNILLVLIILIVFAQSFYAKTKKSEREDLLLTSILTEFMEDSEMQLVIDMDLFRSLLSLNPGLDSHTQLPFWRKMLKLVEPLKQYDVSAPCIADLSHFLWHMIRFIKADQLVTQCDLNNNCSCVNSANTEADRTEWVFKVLDSMGKVPPGILSGNNLFVGSWDTCRSIDTVKNRQRQKWRGKYCMAHLQWYNKDNPLRPNRAKDTDTCGIPTDSSPLQTSDDMNCFTLIPLLNYGLCVPDTCTQYDVHKMLQLWLKSVELAANRSIVCHTDVVCHDAKSNSLTDHPSSLIMISFLCTVATLMTFGTLYDYYVYQEYLRSFPESDDILRNKDVYDMQPWLVKIVLAFSLYTNGKSILRTERTANQIHCLHGMRVLSMFWIILGHTYYYIIASLTVDNLLPTLIEFPVYFANQMIVQAPLAVDSFFFLSGMLMSFLWFRITNRMKGRNVGSAAFWGQFYFHRYMRLTPLYLAIMCSDVLIFSHITDGPFWRPIERNYCRKSWWTNIIYLNNFLLQHVEVCMGWTWYLANDFQFYCLAPILLILLWKQEKVGLAVSGLIVCLSSLLKMSITLANGYPPAPILTANLHIVKDLNDYWPDVYIKPYIRCGPYVIGVLVGYLLYRHGMDVKLKWWQVTGGWIVSTFCGLMSVFGLFNYAKTGEISRVASIAYMLLGRNAFAFSLAWVTYACSTGHGGPVNAFLSWKGWTPLSRITFSAYLFHPILLQIYYLSRPVTYHYASVYQIVSIFVTTAIVAYFCAFFISCAFEIPVGILEKMATEKLSKHAKRQKLPSAQNTGQGLLTEHRIAANVNVGEGASCK